MTEESRMRRGCASSKDYSSNALNTKHQSDSITDEASGEIETSADTIISEAESHPTHKRPQSAKRFDEVRACGDWFANIYYAAQDAARYSPESDDITELSCAYNNTVHHGEPMSPIMALRMPRMVKQPQQWLIDVIRGLGW